MGLSTFKPANPITTMSLAKCNFTPKGKTVFKDQHNGAINSNINMVSIMAMAADDVIQVVDHAAIQQDDDYENEPYAAEEEDMFDPDAPERVNVALAPQFERLAVTILLCWDTEFVDHRWRNYDLGTVTEIGLSWVDTQLLRQSSP
ncbi:MAG: hypothetical protein Q9221_003084 [Calogaya cf. arnoldii]